MTARTVSFDRSGHSLDAVQRAAYRLSDRLSAASSFSAKYKMSDKIEAIPAEGSGRGTELLSIAGT
jgi:hypothetical protein